MVESAQEAVADPAAAGVVAAVVAGAVAERPAAVGVAAAVVAGAMDAAAAISHDCLSRRPKCLENSPGPVVAVGRGWLEVSGIAVVSHRDAAPE